MRSFELFIGVMGFDTAKLNEKTDVFAVLSKIGGSEGRFEVWSDIIRNFCVYSYPACCKILLKVLCIF